MMNITAPRFTDPDAAREHLEALHWPNGPFCPRCGSVDVKRLPTQLGRKTKAHPHGTERKGVVQCNGCRQQFTVTVGTVFESSKVPLNKWLLANHLLCASKKGISAHQLSRMLGVTYKTAWFMAHRIREAMTPTDNGPMGGPGCDVEVDETFIGIDKSVTQRATPAYRNRNKIVSLIDRTTGRSTSIHFGGKLNAADVGSLLYTRIDRQSRLITDEARFYLTIGREFASHGFVTHSRDEYVSKKDRTVTTNTVEGFFAIFKRGMKGIYQHCGSQHLQRYLAEFDFRYSNRVALGINDDERAEIALRGIAGKRLTYRRIAQLAA